MPPPDHPTPDFLIRHRNHEQTPVFVDACDMHEKMAKECLGLLSGRPILKRDICSLQKPGISRKDIDGQVVDKCLPPEIQYACRYWAYHVQQSRGRIHDMHPVYLFLKTYFLYWLESLSLIGGITDSVNIIIFLQQCLVVG